MQKKMRLVTWAVIYSIFIAFIVLGVLYAFSSRKTVNGKDEDNIEDICGKKSDAIEDILSSIKLATDVAAETIQERITSLEDITDDAKRTEFTKTAEALLYTINDAVDPAIGSYIRYNVELTSSTAGVFMIKDDLGLHEVSTTDIKNPGDDVTVWYDEPKAKGHAVWLTPYYNLTEDKTIISYVIPVYFDGTFVAVIGLDVNFEEITSLIRSDETYAEGYFYILNPDGTAAYSPEGKTEAKSSYHFSSEFINGMTLCYTVSYASLHRTGDNMFTTILTIIASIFAGVTIIGLVMLRFILRQDKKNEQQNRYLGSIASIYSATYVIHPKANTYEIISGSDAMAPYLDVKHPDLRYSISEITEEFCDEAYKKILCDFMDIDTIDVRMEAHDAISEEFRAKKQGWCRVSFIRVSHATPEEDVIVAIELINDAKMRETKMKYMSETDQMTGILNRGAGENYIRKMIAAKERGMLVLLDADKFKSFNDTFGHEVGDQVIKSIAMAVKNAFESEENIVMRLGGDEFAAYLVGVNDSKLAQIYIDRLFREINSITIPQIGQKKITISVGGSYYTGDEKSFENLYKEADEGCYASKARNGNACSIHK